MIRVYLNVDAKEPIANFEAKAQRSASQLSLIGIVRICCLEHAGQFV